MKCPPISTTAIIANDARLAAELSCLLARGDTYLSVLDGPRLARPDAEAEVARRLNSIARIRAQQIILAGLSDDADALLSSHTGARQGRFKIVKTIQDAQQLSQALPEVISWGSDSVGVGLLKALRRGSAIKFVDRPSASSSLSTLSGHLVVCEDGDDLAQVVAANYAYALGAGLAIIQKIDRTDTEAILERFYSVQDDRNRAASEALEELGAELRKRCANVSLDGVKSLTFIGGGLPYGFAFPEFPSTHLFDYPDLGISIANGFSTQQDRSRGIDVAVLVDPKTTEAPEMRAAEKLLPSHGVFLRCYEGGGATVRNVTEMVELFPYDLLIFATHCGDVSGWRWTYNYKDAEGLEREFVVDIAIGVADTDQQNMLLVTQFMRFVSLDGIEWNDAKRKKDLYVGTAITTFMERTRSAASTKLEPTKREAIPRVVGSAALKMADDNFLALPQSLADEGLPIVLNNACCSWHQLARTFAFGGARAYLGTLFPVLTSEAEAVTVALLGGRFGECLPEALWAAQTEAFGTRRPYLIMGVYPQAMRVIPGHVPQYLARRLKRAATEWLLQAEKNSGKDAKTDDWIAQKTSFYQRELQSLKENWQAE